ncbi:hypothetical protein GTY88_48255 [Streptomyces sp. SID5926]|nr:hypothetical protein [Streptomyces sp. SID5926]
MTDPHAILITEDAQVVSVNLPADQEHFAEYAAALLRCDLVEHVGLATGLHLWLNEEGIGQAPRNFLATRFVQSFPGGQPGLVVHGPLLITGHGDEHVEPLDGSDYRALAMALRELARHP